jgi:hypothetical protein
MPRLTLIFLLACSGASTPPRNLVCERVALLSPDAACVPELSGTGALDTHTARVTLKGATAAVVCGLNAGQLSMACGTLETAPAQGSASK